MLRNTGTTELSLADISIDELRAGFGIGQPQTAFTNAGRSNTNYVFWGFGEKYRKYFKYM
jgi:hypothetical protein